RGGDPETLSSLDAVPLACDITAKATRHRGRPHQRGPSAHAREANCPITFMSRSSSESNLRRSLCIIAYIVQTALPSDVKTETAGPDSKAVGQEVGCFSAKGRKEERRRRKGPVFLEPPTCPPVAVHVPDTQDLVGAELQLRAANLVLLGSTKG